MDSKDFQTTWQAMNQEMYLISQLSLESKPQDPHQISDALEPLKKLQTKTPNTSSERVMDYTLSDTLVEKLGSQSKMETINSTIGTIPIEILIYLCSKFLDIPSISKLSQTCRALNKLCIDGQIYRNLTLHHFCLHSTRSNLMQRLIKLNGHGFWKMFYEQLDSCLTTWSGCALDPLTNDCQPYSMELVIKSVHNRIKLGTQSRERKINFLKDLDDSFFRISTFEGCCRWIELEDALTSVAGTITDLHSQFPLRFRNEPFLCSRLPRLIEFTEREILRGQDLIIPNRYQGFLIGNMMIGEYNPGQSAHVGVFCINMEEALPYLFNDHHKIQTDSHYKGILVHGCSQSSSLETGHYLELSVLSFVNGMLKATMKMYTSSRVETTLTDENHMDETKLNEAIAINLEAKIPFFTSQNTSAIQKFTNIHLTRTERYLPDQEIWLDTAFPTSNNLHLFLSGTSIVGMFLFPKPGCFYVSLLK